ncbi:MAG: hypothetical protein DSY83_10800, partial [Flavobacteriia bacterium]
MATCPQCESELSIETQEKNRLASAMKKKEWFGKAMVVFMLLGPVPQMREILTDMGRDLPLPTVIVLAISDFMAQWWWVVIAAFIGFASFFNKFK